MKLGDLVIWRGHYSTNIGIVMVDNVLGGTVRIFDQDKATAYWVIASECEVISETR